MGDEAYKSNDVEKDDDIQDEARWTAYPPPGPGNFISDYSNVNGIRLYFEVYGAGHPLVLLHGGGSTIQSSFGRIIHELSKTYLVIAVELQNHGRSDFRTIPQTFEQDADDVAMLLENIGIQQASILGFSNGGTTALQLAIRHPGIVNNLIVIAAAFKREGFMKGFFDGMQLATLENMPGALKEEFLKVTPNQSRLQIMFERDRDRMIAFTDINEEAIRGIKAPVLIISGDADVTTTEHALEMQQLIPNARLAILPGIHGECIGEISTLNKKNPRAYIVIELINDFLHRE